MTDRECADKVSECFGANEHGEMTFDYDKAQAIIAARVAEAVRPLREMVEPLTNALDYLRPLGTADALRFAQLVYHARRLLEEADRD